MTVIRIIYSHLKKENNKFSNAITLLKACACYMFSAYFLYEAVLTM